MKLKLLLLYSIHATYRRILMSDRNAEESMTHSISSHTD